MNCACDYVNGKVRSMCAAHHEAARRYYGADARRIEVAQRMADALQRIADMEHTEDNEWDAVDRLIPDMCEIARTARAEWEATR